MKVAICLLFVLVVALAQPPSQYLPPSNQYGPPSAGPQRPSTQYGAPPSAGGSSDQSAPASYQFEYMVQDADSGNDFGHQESREGDVARGRYYVVLPDGRRQVVEYTADNEGYKPMVTYEGQAGGQAGGSAGYPRGPSPPRGGNGGAAPGGNGGYRY